MNIVYADGACMDEANPAVITPKDKLLDPATYLCPSCIRPAFTFTSELHARVLAAQKEREANKQKSSYSLMQHHSGKVDPPRRPIGGAHLIASATDRARQLGLIGGGSGPGSTTSSKSINYPSTDERVKMVRNMLFFGRFHFVLMSCFTSLTFLVFDIVICKSAFLIILV